MRFRSEAERREHEEVCRGPGSYGINDLPMADEEANVKVKVAQEVLSCSRPTKMEMSSRPRSVATKPAINFKQCGR